MNSKLDELYKKRDDLLDGIEVIREMILDIREFAINSDDFLRISDLEAEASAKLARFIDIDDEITKAKTLQRFN